MNALPRHRKSRTRNLSLSHAAAHGYAWWAAHDGNTQDIKGIDAQPPAPERWDTYCKTDDVTVYVRRT